MLCSLLWICHYKRALNQKEKSQKHTRTQTVWGSHAPLPACSYSTVVSIKKLFWQHGSVIRRSCGQEDLPGDLFKTWQRRTTYMTSHCPCQLKLWKEASENSSKPPFAICKLILSLYCSISVIYTFISNSTHHLKKPSSPWDSSFFPPLSIRSSPPGQICGCVWQAQHEGTPQPFYPLWVGCCMMRCDWRWEPTHPSHCSALPSAPARVRGKWSQSGNLAAWKKNPSWVYSSSLLPLLCSSKIPQFEIIHFTVNLDGRWFHFRWRAPACVTGSEMLTDTRVSDCKWRMKRRE